MGILSKDPIQTTKYSSRSFGTVLKTRLYNFNKQLENIKWYKNVFLVLLEKPEGPLIPTLLPFEDIYITLNLRSMTMAFHGWFL